MRSKLIIVAGLIALGTSAVLYLLDYLIFRDSHQLWIQMVDDLSFIPISVFIVVVVIERLLARQEKLALRYKLNMVVGAFFSEVGNPLIHKFLNFYQSSNEIKKHFSINDKWTSNDFKAAIAFANSLTVMPDTLGIDFEGLKTFLSSKRQFLLNLLENPNLLEHEKFTDLLWAIFHLTEELEARSSVTNLPGLDLKHLENDTRRLNGYLSSQWLVYAEHLKDKYPYLFSLVVRMNPYLNQPSATIT